MPLAGVLCIWPRQFTGGYPAHVTELPGEAAAARAGPPASPHPRRRTPRSRQRSQRTPASARAGIAARCCIGLTAGVASAVVASVLGYLCAPALTTTHPSTLQALGLAGALFGGAMFVVMVIVSVQSVRAIRTASRPGSASEAEQDAGDDKDEAGGDKDEKEPEDTPYDFATRPAGTAPDADLAGSGHPGARRGWLCPDKAQLSRHRRHPADDAARPVGDRGGRVPRLARSHPSHPLRHRRLAGVYGPKKEPHLWVLLLRLAGCWLAMTPFSLFSLGAIGLGIYQGLDGAWVAMIFLLTFGFACGVACCYLLAGSGALRGVPLKAGGRFQNGSAPRHGGVTSSGCCRSGPRS